MDPEDDGLVPFGANPFDPHFASNSPFSFGAHSITSPQHDPPNFYTKPWAPYGFPPPAGLPPHRFPPPPPPPPPQGFMSPPGGFSTPDLQSYTGPPYPPYYAHNYGNVDAFTSVPDGYFRSSPALYPYPRPTRAPSPPLEPPRSPSLPRAPPTVRFASPPEYPQLRGFPRPLSLSPPPPPRPRDRSRSSPLFRRERSLERSSRSRSTSLPSTLTSDEWEEYPGSTPAKSQAQSRNESRPSWLSSTSLITPSVPRPVPARQPPSYPIAHPVPPSRVSSFPLPQVAGFQRPQRADLDWHQFNRVVPLSGGRNGRKSKGAKKSDGNGSPTWRKDKFPKHRNLVWNPTSSYGHPGQWPDTESTTREGRNQALYVLESKCYTDHNGDQTTDLTCAATGPELGEMGDEIQFQWLHLQRQTMSLDEMQVCDYTVGNYYQGADISPSASFKELEDSPGP
ncbi:hypothetical protein P152DRAFT_166498 [Eremomyces bilateralis CBS 781.70]|uniref:Uncharacterized protein n=1 Tax=Eremomyces bilateralis CBS 781.70 TaxID=1392243 RepID=A0A6G1FTM5_9PEZI|nr:uncharacterized protein P152DRAFT_166498 [Eremomyces bilateralis CBS 781.70]KAF1809235.1 hypothetical protein P152DRAFT_166498 [Eremomyces bilateralis CBS 781.70]